MKNGITPKRDYSHGAHLEPRVAKLELGMERLTDDVRDLAQVVRSQGQNMEGEIQKLVIAVTQAAGPKKTDWGTIIAGLALIMAIGSAAFWPLNQTVQENKQDLVRYEQKLSDHTQIEMHPVGRALIERLEKQAISQWEEHQKDVLDIRACIENKLQPLNLRLTVLEEQYRKDIERERDELAKWRQKAMGMGDSAVTIKKPQP